MTMLEWIHHVLNPHCVECRERSEELQVCKSCEILKQQLESANYEKKQLLQAVIDKSSPRETAATEPNYESIKSSSLPWIARKQMLEAEDRERAKLMRNKVSTDKTPEDINIEELEKQLGIVS